MESAPRQTSAYGWHNPRLTLQQARCTSLRLHLPAWPFPSPDAESCQHMPGLHGLVSEQILSAEHVRNQAVVLKCSIFCLIWSGMASGQPLSEY